MVRWIILLVLLPSLLIPQNSAFAQEQKHSTSNQIIPSKGTVNILILFAVEADAMNISSSSAHWPNGNLPVWAKEVVNSDTLNGKGMLSAFFKESSFSKMNVLGDYHSGLIELQSSKLPNIADCRVELSGISSFSQLNTSQNKNPSWFDNLTMNSEYAPLLIPGKDKVIKYDHVMVILRSETENVYATGYKDNTKFFGFEADSWSIVSSDGTLPIAGIKAALGDLILGPYSGVREAGGLKYLNSYSWALSSPSVSLFQTISAYERAKLGWIKSDPDNPIACLTREGKEIPADLDAMDSNFEGIYILRDFVKTGDAIRIKLPYRDSEGNKQFIWLENHLTTAGNKSAFDNFDRSCPHKVHTAQKGVYAYLQRGAFSDIGHASVSFIQLPSGGFAKVQEREDKTGHDYKESAFAIEGFDHIDMCSFSTSLAYTFSGNKSINIGTNPSASMVGYKLNDVSIQSALSAPVQSVEQRVVYLNGVAIELIKEHKDGAIELRVIFDDTWVGKNSIWAADSIIVPTVRLNEVYSIGLARSKRISLVARTLESGVKERATSMFLLPGSVLYMENDAVLDLQEGSTLVLYPGSKLIMRTGAQLNIGAGCRVDAMPGSRIVLPDKRGILIDKEAIINSGADSITREDGKSHRIRGTVLLN